jgi:hypothetical protein
MAGVLKGLIFNGARRSSRYWFYWIPPVVGTYYIYKSLKERYVRFSLSGMHVLTHRNEFYNSKAGHAYLAKIEQEEEAKKMKQPTKG